VFGMGEGHLCSEWVKVICVRNGRRSSVFGMGEGYLCSEWVKVICVRFNTFNAKIRNRNISIEIININDWAEFSNGV
jgi:hypothetical protein